MEEWKSRLKQLADELKSQEPKQQFPEDPVDVVLRIAIGSTYKPKNDEVAARIVRNHRAPYVVRTVKEGSIVYAEPPQNVHILEGDFVAIKVTDWRTGRDGRYGVGKITKVYE